MSKNPSLQGSYPAKTIFSNTPRFGGKVTAAGQRREDLTALSFANDTFDLIICSHVLEHIVDAERAVSEMYRVLKNSGVGLVLVPIPLDLQNDIMERGVLTVEDRMRLYGQEDHVRLFSKKGFLGLLQSVFFRVDQVGEKELEVDFHREGIEKRSILYVVKKI